jgi:cobalamin biosynthesis protein CobC
MTKLVSWAEIRLKRASIFNQCGLTMSDNQTTIPKRDHGGGLDAAMAQYGGSRSDWIDLSTGINPAPYPVSGLKPHDWTTLPDQAAHDALIKAAREFWPIPDGADILPAPGASSLIARIPLLAPTDRVRIQTPTYNEHAAAFDAQGWEISETEPANARVLVHPNNPDGRLWRATDITAPLTIIDESFCDIAPDATLIQHAAKPGVVVLKSFGKFWGLAGLRLGFAIAAPELITRLSTSLGPWPASGPALRIGAKALQDAQWATQTRTRLALDRSRLDRLMTAHGAVQVGGTDLFRLYTVDNATRWQEHLAKHHIWTRIFPWSETHLRLGLPTDHGWDQLEIAL